MKDPLVSIVIPCYNDVNYIEQCVNSALNQTYQNKEIIIIDDGSNEKTKHILKTIEPKISKLISQDNQGQSKARNVGVSVAKGDYILVLDSDDYFEPMFLEKAINLFLNNEDIKLITCYTKILYENNSNVDLFKPKGGKIEAMLKNNIATGSAIYKKSNFIEAGGYDVKMRKGFEDWEFYIRLLSKGGEVGVIPEYLFFYRRKNNSTTTIANKNRYDLLRYIYTKNEAIFKEYFTEFVDFLLKRIEREEIEKLKMKSTIEYKLGSRLLFFPRLLKKIVK